MNDHTMHSARHAGHDAQGASTPTPGVSTAQDGYLLTPVVAPAVVGLAGSLSLQIVDPHGAVVTDYGVSHERTMHLIVVRADGSQFRHVHPTIDGHGMWSLPWTWTHAGTYRVYADFALAADGGAFTLSRTVHVAGDFAPQSIEPTDTVVVDGFTVDLQGELVAGVGSELTFTVSEVGVPVTYLQPYLGAFGHLVALRDGDLAFLHVHPTGREPQAGETSGPEIRFALQAPTPGTYFLHLDFQVDGSVHSAPLVVRARS